jgi:hypothetical protein
MSAAFIVLLVANWRAARAADVEQSRYDVLGETAGFELRLYAPSIEARVSVDNDSAGALSSGFRRLASYIFGGNGTGQRIQMTAPVTSEETTDGWAMSFIMPSDYSFDDLPSPRDQYIELVKKPGRTVAALSFSGWARPAVARKMEQQLLSLLNEEGLQPVGPLVLAQYDPPTRLPFLRRNEILAPLGPSADSRFQALITPSSSVELPVSPEMPVTNQSPSLPIGD